MIHYLFSLLSGIKVGVILKLRRKNYIKRQKEDGAQLKNLVFLHSTDPSHLVRKKHEGTVQNVDYSYQSGVFSLFFHITDDFFVLGLGNLLKKLRISLILPVFSIKSLVWQLENKEVSSSNFSLIMQMLR